MKFIFKSLATVVAAVVLLIGFLYFYTGGMTQVADDYFVAVSAGEQDQAMELLADYVVNDAASIVNYLKDNDMGDVKSSSWHARNFVNNKGSIAGEVVNNQGEKIPTRMDFFKQDGDWKIYAIAVQRPKASMKPIEPTVQEQEKMVSQSMNYFMNAAKGKSMKQFYQKISNYWQSQTTVEELDQAFASIYKFTGDYALFSKVIPTIESAIIDENNLLVINGFYPLNNARVVIQQKYIYEATSWQLMSFSYSNEKT